MNEEARQYGEHSLSMPEWDVGLIYDSRAAGKYYAFNLERLLLAVRRAHGSRGAREKPG